LGSVTLEIPVSAVPSAGEINALSIVPGFVPHPSKKKTASRIDGHASSRDNAIAR